MTEYSLERYLGWFVAGLVSIVAYFLKMAHRETKQDIKEIQLKISSLESKQVLFETKQAEMEKSISSELKHIREIVDTHIGNIDKNVQLILTKVQK